MGHEDGAVCAKEKGSPAYGMSKQQFRTAEPRQVLG